MIELKKKKINDGPKKSYVTTDITKAEVENYHVVPKDNVRIKDVKKDWIRVIDEVNRTLRRKGVNENILKMEYRINYGYGKQIENYIILKNSVEKVLESKKLKEAKIRTKETGARELMAFLYGAEESGVKVKNSKRVKYILTSKMLKNVPRLLYRLFSETKLHEEDECDPLPENLYLIPNTAVRHLNHYSDLKNHLPKVERSTALVKKKHCLQESRAEKNNVRKIDMSISIGKVLSELYSAVSVLLLSALDKASIMNWMVSNFVAKEFVRRKKEYNTLKKMVIETDHLETANIQGFTGDYISNTLSNLIAEYHPKCEQYFVPIGIGLTHDFAKLCHKKGIVERKIDVVYTYSEEQKTKMKRSDFPSESIKVTDYRQSRLKKRGKKFVMYDCPQINWSFISPQEWKKKLEVISSIGPKCKGLEVVVKPHPGLSDTYLKVVKKVCSRGNISVINKSEDGLEYLEQSKILITKSSTMGDVKGSHEVIQWLPQKNSTLLQNVYRTNPIIAESLSESCIRSAIEKCVSKR